MFSTFHNTAIGAAALALAAGFAAPAQAGYTVTLTQRGNNVVATGSGPIDLTGLSLIFGIHTHAFIFPSAGAIFTGLITGAPPLDDYTTITGPTSFGSGRGTLADSSSGDIVGVEAQDAPPDIFVPHGYVSDAPLSGTSFYAGQTFAGLGVTPGTFEWTWGTGVNQNFTLDISTAPPPVPEPASLTLLAMGLAGLGVALRPRA